MVYSDGASRGNGTSHAKAGVGVFFGPDDSRNVCEPLPGPVQTNQRAEIMAAIRSLEMVLNHEDVEVRTDSNYVVQGRLYFLRMG